MKTRLLLSLLFLMFIMGASRKPSRYVSAWTLIPANGSISFVHGLSERPQVVSVWGAHFLNQTTNLTCQAVFNEVFSAYESEELFLQSVSNVSILVKNTGDVGLCVQVMGEP